MAYFDFKGNVQIKISAPEIQSAVVRPLSLGIKSQISKNQLSFSLEEPSALTIELNGDTKRAVHLFANPLEENVPSPDGPNVIYFAPGVY